MHLDVPWLIQNELGSIYTHTLNGRSRKREGNLARAVVLIWWLPSLVSSDVGQSGGRLCRNTLGNKEKC